MTALAKPGSEQVEGRDARNADLRLGLRSASEHLSKPLKLFGNPLGNGVTVAQQTLTLFVLVRIQVPQPALSSATGITRPGVYFDKISSITRWRRRLPASGWHAMVRAAKRGRVAGGPSRASFPKNLEKNGLGWKSLHEACIEPRVFLGVTII